MIISVICPNCGKKIQIDDSNDANICICCNRAFVTEKAQKCDENPVKTPPPVKATPAKQPKAHDGAERYYENVIGLLEKGKTLDDDALCSNLSVLRKKFPLDIRLQVVEFKLAFQAYKEAKEFKNGHVKKTFDALDALVGTDYYDECYNAVKEEAKKVSKSDNDGSLYLKLILQDVKPTAIIRYYEKYKKEQELYKKTYSTYQSELLSYERKLKDYDKEVERYQKSVWEGTTPLSFPFKPLAPVAPRSPRFGDSSINVLDEIVPLITIEEKEDFEYLTNKYRELSKYYETISSITYSYGNVLKKIYSLLPDDCKKKLSEEEKAKREKIKAEKTEKILAELKKFWEEYILLLEFKKFKDAYKHLADPKTVEGKQIPTLNQLTKFSKGLFSTKYNGDVNQLDAETLAKITFKNMNFTF